MSIEYRDGKYLVVDANGKILLMTHKKTIAQSYLTKLSK